MTLLSLERPMR